MRAIDSLKPKADVYDSLFEACKTSSDVRTAAAMMEDMRSHGVNPSVQQHDAYVSIAVAANQQETALRALFDTADVFRTVPSMRAYSAVLRHLCSSDQPTLVLQVLRFMSANGQRPDQAIFNLVGSMRRYDVVLEGIQKEHL
jgi:pentatricopeptide repeat protein